ncbi:protein of unknown function (plasmid) [Cupriavidus taiwanensis]|uniref:Uncharacterized protein n=1 Tax=Cupriavidus taiwanensis TaxID=164546 RepID=A0A375HFK6_9BURK|nr:protein of unknown function [Cupriavidus taiwanensis]SOZ74633.1 protein of unknown function [Cupriavidus taiwanensis]SPA11441.1 protein of unknown function [Cupriavidus taiwanensis]SPD49173.1 protein of unknown function [Cupriavidus taiwanensis]
MYISLVYKGHLHSLTTCTLYWLRQFLDLGPFLIVGRRYMYREQIAQSSQSMCHESFLPERYR